MNVSSRLSAEDCSDFSEPSASRPHNKPLAQPVQDRSWLKRNRFAARYGHRAPAASAKTIARLIRRHQAAVGRSRCDEWPQPMAVVRVWHGRNHIASFPCLRSPAAVRCSLASFPCNGIRSSFVAICLTLIRLAFFTSSQRTAVARGLQKPSRHSRKRPQDVGGHAVG